MDGLAASDSRSPAPTMTRMAASSARSTVNHQSTSRLRSARDSLMASLAVAWVFPLPMPLPAWGEHLCFQSSRFFDPEAIFVNQGIGERDELSGDGCEGLLGGLCLLVPEPAVEGFEVWVAAYGRDGRQVEGRSDMLASAPDAAPALALARVAGDRGEADEHGDGFGRQHAELGETGNERAGDDAADAGDGGEDLLPAGERRVICDQPIDLGVEMRDMPLDGRQELLDVGDQEPALGGTEPVLERRLLGDCGSAREDQPPALGDQWGARP